MKSVFLQLDKDNELADKDHCRVEDMAGNVVDCPVGQVSGSRQATKGACSTILSLLILALLYATVLS